MKNFPLLIIHMPLYGSMVLTAGAEEGEGGTQHEENQLGSLRRVHLKCTPNCRHTKGENPAERKNTALKPQKGGSDSVPFCEKEEQCSLRKIFCKKNRNKRNLFRCGLEWLSSKGAPKVHP